MEIDMDIVEWLRTYGSEPSRLNEAADEIERLRDCEAYNARSVAWANVEIERLREALEETETICLAQYVMLVCAGENEKANHVKKVADKLFVLLKKETEL
jgi:hypothetical protein